LANNIRFYTPEATDEAIQQAIQLVGLDELVNPNALSAHQTARRGVFDRQRRGPTLLVALVPHLTLA
jgi:hypothetical protein